MIAHAVVNFKCSYCKDYFVPQFSTALEKTKYCCKECCRNEHYWQNKQTEFDLKLSKLLNK